MVTVLPSRPPKQPSFGQQIVGGLLGGVPGAIDKFQAMEQKQQAQQMQMEQENRQRDAFAELLGPEYRNLPMETLQEFGKIALKAQADKELQAQKLSGKAQEKQQIQDTAQNAFNRMAELLHGGNLGFGSGVKSFFGGKTAENTAEFDTLTGALEAMMVDMVSRGTLSNSRFKYITEFLLPKSTDIDSKIMGKLKAVARELNLDPAALQGGGIKKTEGGRTGKINIGGGKSSGKKQLSSFDR